MKQYIDLVLHVLENGEKKSNRTGTNTISTFGWQNVYDLRKGFPLLTTKKVNINAIKAELLWFIKGNTNINDLKAIYPTKIWDDWADTNGELGPVYGAQWRKWQATTILDSVDIDDAHMDEANIDNIELKQMLSKYKLGVYETITIDQLSRAINDIKFNPDSRRIIVSSWNVAQIDQMALPPCHTFYQFNVAGQHLDLQLYQRSADIALGVPFNIASYALLLTMVAQECSLIPRHFIHTLGDAHIYEDHIEGLKEQINRQPLELPSISIQQKPFFDITFDDIQLNNYNYHSAIQFPIAV